MFVIIFHIPKIAIIRLLVKHENTVLIIPALFLQQLKNISPTCHICECYNFGSSGYYQQRKTAEIFYDTFKNDLNGDRITDHKRESYEGKMFVLFIAMAILTRLKSKLAHKRNGNRTLGRLKTYSQLLFRMSTLSEVSFKGKYKPIYSTPTKLQKEIINSFDLR